MPDCLEAARKPGVAKKVQKDKIWPNKTSFHTEDLKSKNVKGIIVFILAKDIKSGRKFEIKAEKVSAWKRSIFWGHPISGSWSQMLKTFLQMIYLFLKYWDPEKNQPLHFTISWDWYFRVVKGPRPWGFRGRIKTTNFNEPKKICFPQWPIFNVGT